MNIIFDSERLEDRWCSGCGKEMVGVMHIEGMGGVRMDGRGKRKGLVVWCEGCVWTWGLGEVKR